MQLEEVLLELKDMRSVDYGLRTCSGQRGVIVQAGLQILPTRNVLSLGNEDSKTKEGENATHWVRDSDTR